MLETLVSFGATIIEYFAPIFDWLNTNGYVINGTTYSYAQLIFGGAITLIIVSTIVRWVISFIP